jgi:hypothetical protein
MHAVHLDKLHMVTYLALNELCDSSPLRNNAWGEHEKVFLVGTRMDSLPNFLTYSRKGISLLGYRKLSFSMRIVKRTRSFHVLYQWDGYL